MQMSDDAIEEQEQHYNRQLLGLRGGTEEIIGFRESKVSSVVLNNNHDNDNVVPVANISIPLHFNSGSHHAHLYIGSPPQRQTLIIDTGSKAMAFPCKTCKKCAPCCGTHASPYFDPSLIDYS